MRTTATTTTLAAALVVASAAIHGSSAYEVRDDLHFPIHARATNKDGTTPVYKNPDADIEARIADLLPRMTLEEKVAQLYVPEFSIMT
jgi:beta-glucosidase